MQVDGSCIANPKVDFPLLLSGSGDGKPVGDTMEGMNQWAVPAAFQPQANMAPPPGAVACFAVDTTGGLSLCLLCSRL